MSPRTAWDQKYLAFTNPVETDEHGIAIFKVTAQEIGRPSGRLDMDGVIFVFGYCVEVEKEGEEGSTEDVCETTYTNRISFLIWGKTKYSELVFWDDHDLSTIRNTLSSYEKHLATGTIYEDVVKPHNIQLLFKAMDPEMYEHLSYMTVTRDLSPSRIEMILKWLKSAKKELKG